MWVNKKESGDQEKGTSQTWQQFSKIITLLDPRNSENSNRTVYSVKYLDCYCSEACILYFLLKCIIRTGSEWDVLHHMSNLLYLLYSLFNALYSFIWKHASLLKLYTISEINSKVNCCSELMLHRIVKDQRPVQKGK